VVSAVDALDVLTTTRSVRLRLDLERPVDLDVVRSCIKTALQAPTGGDREEWRWIVVADQTVREKIGAVYQAAFHARYPRGDEPIPNGARYLSKVIGSVPVMVIPCLEVAEGRLETRENQAGIWGSILPAAWSYMLAARAAGLATAWTSVHLDAEAEVADILGLPPTIRQAALIPTAHPVGDEFRPARRRRSLDEVLLVDRWPQDRT
jgi:nitroreductase